MASGGTLDAFLSLGLESVPDDWVCQLWSDNFCESSPLPIEDHDALFSEVNWQAVVRVATEWLYSRNVETKGKHTPSKHSVVTCFIETQLWEVLADGNITYKAMIAVIFSMVDRLKEVKCVVC